MDQARFDAMVRRLEAHSQHFPRRYQAEVALLALAGFVLLVLILSMAGLGLVVLAGLVVAVVLTGGHAALLLIKLGKLLLFLAIPLWFLIKSSMGALFTRLPKPQGMEVTRAQAPALFEAMDRMRQRMKGPRFHHVLITDDVNAAVMQRPVFGLFGWPRNYLILGLPLLESFGPDEALAVVAHEYGHLAGSHSRFGAYIYRLRQTWGTIQAIASQWQGWMGRRLQAIVGWYAPYFNAYTFVLARTNEYQADAASAELVGASTMARALKRSQLASAHYEAFMARTFEAMADQPAPPDDIATRWAQQAAGAVPEEQTRRWLDQALKREPHAMDTHPALALRLRALPGVEQAEHAPEPLTGPSAAQAWLGTHADTLRERLQNDWYARVRAPWAERHENVQAQRERLNELLALETPDMGQQLEALRLKCQLQAKEDHVAALQAFNTQFPDQALGLFLEAQQRLAQGDQQDDEQAITLFERVITLDPEATKPACEAIWQHLREKGQTERAKSYSDRWQQRDTLEHQRALEMNTVSPKHTLLSPTQSASSGPSLQEADLQQMVRLARHDTQGIKGVHLARRVLPSDPSVQTYVLGVELTWWARQRKQHQAIVDRLAAHAWPLPHVMIVALDGSQAPLKPLLKKAGALDLISC
jgi:Zn-dependent protease with chaperone function